MGDAGEGCSVAKPERALRPAGGVEVLEATGGEDQAANRPGCIQEGLDSISINSKHNTVFTNDAPSCL